jgi:hypothetical protein
VSEVVNPKVIDLSQPANPPEPLTKIIGIGLLEIALVFDVGLRRE